jgi:DNA-binding response OmpR family regulator
MMTHTDNRHAVASTPPLRRIMVVGNDPGQRVLETVANAANYDVIIVESAARAYSHIKRVVPSLVVLCLDLDDPDTCQVLSMLKLDSTTSTIPVVTYTATGEACDDETSSEDVELAPN